MNRLQCLIIVAVASVAGTTVAAAQTAASKEQLARGDYLVRLGGCNDCHSPKLMTSNGPAPDPAKLLSGFPANGQVPPVPPGTLAPDKWAAMTNADLTLWVGRWGTSFSANLTPDKATGIGGWSADQFIKTIRTGKHLGVGRAILPPMPWFGMAGLTDRDLKAIFAYLMSVKPIENPVPQPIPPR
jgi:mono/diheme cytochrome c family protein